MSQTTLGRFRFGTVVLTTLALLLLTYFVFALLIDPRTAPDQLRKFSVAVAMNACWAAIGAVLVAWTLPEHRRKWRLAVLSLALMGTGISLYFQSAAYNATVLPPLLDMLVPMTFGALTAGVLAVLSPGIPDLGPQPVGRPARLWRVIAVALLFALPMIVAPVVEHWNASGWMDSHGYDTYAHNILSGQHPAGSSQYMPVYQYGLAAVYYVFGHFFFAQQLVNVVLALLTIVLLCLAAWNLFRNVWAVLLIGIWSAFLRQFVYAVFFTQIESWYIPIIAFTIFAWSCYWRTPSRRHLVLLALGAAIAINTRNQGAFYFAWLCLAPFFIAAVPWRRRLTHTALAIGIVAASLVPWSVRNYMIDGRFSPSAARNSYYVAVLNDPRIGFYGVRYWEGWGDITAEYVRKYPDDAERDRVMMRDGFTAPFRNPGWFVRAMYWRTVAFYGLIPSGIFADGGPRATDWPAEWRGYVYWRAAPLLFIPLSIIGLLTRPGRVTVFLAVAVLANVAAVAIAGGSEDRVSYPVLPMHMLMGLAAVFAPLPHEPRWNVFRAIAGVATARTWLVIGVAVMAFLAIARLHFGRDNLYAPQLERTVFVNGTVAIDPALPSLNDYAAATATPVPLGPEWHGRMVRLRLIPFNYQCPPKYGGAIGYMPAFATDPNRETYYYAALLLPPGHPKEHATLAVSWFGAVVNERLREGDEVEAEGRVLPESGNAIATYWIQIEKARKVVPRTSDVPAFF